MAHTIVLLHSFLLLVLFYFVLTLTHSLFIFVRGNCIVIINREKKTKEKKIIEALTRTIAKKKTKVKRSLQFTIPPQSARAATNWTRNGERIRKKRREQMRNGTLIGVSLF